MVFGNEYIKFFLVLLQCYTSMEYGLNIDCNGKAFHCVNATHFKICVDLGGGVSKTVDDFLLPCPDNTFCMPTNYYECEYHEITTSTTTSTTTIASEFSAITSDLSKVSVIPLLSAEKKSEATTVQDDAEYKVSSTQEILMAPSTVSILEIIENTSNKPPFKNVKDEKLTSATLLEPNATENFNDKSLYFNNLIKHLENRTENFVINNKTKYSSVISEVPNNISDKNVTLNESTKGGSVNNIENIDSTKLTEQEIILNETKTTEKNVTSDDFENVFNTDSISVEIKMNNETSEKNIKNTSLNVSNNTESEIDINNVTETTSLDPTLSISYSASVEKSIKENSTESNTSSVINTVLNKTSDKNGIEKNIGPRFNPISIAKNNDSYNMQNIAKTQLNINGSETLVSTTVTFNKAFEKNYITNIVVTTTPTNKNNLQVATDNNIDDVEFIENFINASTNPNIIVNDSNLSFDDEKQTIVSNDSVIHKLSKGLEFEKESTVNITVNLPTFFEGSNLNSSLTLNSTDSPEVIITTINLAELRDEMKIETNNASKFTNLNIFSVSLNEAERNSSTTEVRNVTFTTEKSSYINQNNNINTYPEDNDKFSEDGSILNSTTQQPEIKSPYVKSENLSENYIKILHNSNTPNILELLTTTEYNEVVKTNTNNLNVEDFKDDLQKMLIQAETIKYKDKNETNDNVTDFTEKDRIINSNVLPDFINASMSISNDSIIHKLSKGQEFEKESTVNITVNLPTFFEGGNPNSSLSFNSTESPEVVITPINVTELRDEMKIETNNASKFTNLNKFSVSLTEAEKNSSTTEVRNVTFTTEKSSYINQNNNINTYPKDNVKFSGDSSIFDYTTQQPEIKMPNVKSENVNENYIKILHNSNTPNILQLLTTTEYNEVVKTYTNNFNVEDFRDDLQKELIQTETIKYNHKNETNDNVTYFTEKDRIINSNVLPDFKNTSMSVSNFENNIIDASTNKVIKKAFDNENDSDNVITSTTSKFSYTNSLHTTTNTDTVADLKDEVLIPNQKNSTSFTFSSTTKNYDKDTFHTSYVDYKDTNIINTSTTYHSSFVQTTTKSYKVEKTNENYSHETDLKADLTSSINDKKPLSDLLYISKNYNNSSNSESLNIKTTSSVFHTPSLLATTERYEATSIALDHLSLTEPRGMVKQNIDGSRWLDNSSLVAVKNNTINATNSFNSIYFKIGDDRKDNTADSNINTTNSAGNTSSLLITTTDYDAISTTTDNLYMTNFKNKIKLPNDTNTYSTKENIFITNTSKVSEIQNKTPIFYNLQERFSTETIPSVLKNTLIELHETTTQTGQNYSSENDGVLNGIFSSIHIDNESKNTTNPVNNFQEHFNNIFNVTLLRFNETPQRQQDEVDKQKIMMNSSEVNKHILYPIHLLLLSKGNNSEVHDDNLETTEVKLKPIHLDTTIKQNIVQNASLDDVSNTHDFTTSTLIKITEEYKSTTPLVPRLITHNIGSSIIYINKTSKAKTNSSYPSMPIQIQISTISKETQLKQKLNTTEFFHSTLPVIAKSERINFTDNANLYGQKHNITAKNYNILEKDLPLKIAKKDEIIDTIVHNQNKNYTIPNNAEALFEDLLSTSDMPTTKNTTLAPLFENDIISKEPIKATYQVSIPKLSSVSDTSKHNNLTINFINKLVTDFYARISETNSDVNLNISSQKNYMNSDTPMDLQITKQTLPSKSDTTLIDATKFSSDILDTLESTTPYEYTTDAYSPESQLRNIYKSSDSTLIDTISENKESLQHKLSGIALNDKPSNTQSIEINTGNTVNNYLLAQVPAPALILTDKSHSSFVHNVTENNLMTLPDTDIAIRWKDTLNSSTTTEDSKFYSSIKNINKPIIDTKNKELNQLKELKTITSSLELKSNTNQNKTQNTGVNLDNASVTNFRNPTNPTSILVTPKELSFDSPILIKVKSTTVKAIINYSNSDNTNVKNTPSDILAAKSFHSIHSKNYIRTQNVTTDLSKDSVKADIIKANKCFNQPNGKYADQYDCKKFYLCLGDAMPVLGECPNGTVFSESKKQCTKNLSQCYRNNQFTCLTPGRYYDLSIKNVYYICVKNRGKFIKFKYQCQNGYSLNETIVKCIKDSDTSAQNNSDSLNTKEDSTSVSVESSSKATETLNIKSSKKDTEFECKKEGKFPHPKKCNQYYLCTKIKKSVFRRKLKACDSGEVFDKEKNQCADTDSHEC